MNKNIFFFFLFLIQSFSLWGKSTSQGLVQEFLENNKQIESNKLNIENAKLGFDLVKSQKNWVLFGQSLWSENKLIQSLPEPKELQSNFLGVQKDFEWGGQFQFKNYFNTFDQTDEFSQEVIYKQNLGRDFFGREFYRELDIAALTKGEVTSQMSQVNEGLLLNFFLRLNSSKLNKALINLQKEAYIRSIKRQKNIKKRVRAGILDKVNLHKSHLEVLFNQEEIRKAQINFQSDLEFLSGELGREVLESEIIPFNYDHPKNPKVVKGEVTRNKNFERLKNKIEVINARIRKVGHTFFPKIALNLSYKSNSYKTDMSDAFLNGRIGSDNREYKAFVEFSMPIGFGPNKVQRSRERVSLLQKRLEQQKLKKELDEVEKGLSKRIDLIRRNIKSAIDRKKWAKKALNENNRLYRISRVDIDAVLRSEEDLINTEKSIVGYLTNLHGILATKSTLYGNLENFLKSRN